MTSAVARPAGPLDERLSGPVGRILQVQLPNGAIPWFEDGPWDPWNHGECVMALAVVGEIAAARAGLDSMAELQRPDGAWLGEYGNVTPMADRTHLARVKPPAFLDTNFAAYCAVVVWHYAKVAGVAAARPYWPMVRAALNFVIGLQHPEGDISWCYEAHGCEKDDAVRAGCASIYKSLECGIRLADRVGDPQPAWAGAREALGAALRERPERFDRGGVDRSTFAMDWYYPVLTGVVQGVEAHARLEAGWDTFVDAGLGCRCVSDQPWVTVAETCELAMALLAAGRRSAASTLLAGLERQRDSEGVYWMGWQFEERIFWPEERPTWTQAAAILAFDALEQVSPAWQVLTGNWGPRACVRP